MKRSEIFKIAGDMASGVMSNPATHFISIGSYGYQQVLQDCVNAVATVACSMGLSTDDIEDGANPTN